MFNPQFHEKILKAANEVGVSVVFDDFLRAGYFVTRDNRRVFFKGHDFSLNSSAAVRIAIDKHLTISFLRQAGHSVPDSLLLIPPAEQRRIRTEYGAYAPAMATLADAETFAREKAYPLIVKPNALSGGQGVTKVDGVLCLREAVKRIFQMTQRTIVQKFHSGRDYRVLMLDHEVLMAYERTPLTVKGDGKQTIEHLLKEKIESHNPNGQPLEINPRDPRIVRRLRREGLTLKHCLEKGRHLRLLDNANTCTGGSCKNLTDRIHPDYVALCRSIVTDTRLRLCGIDLLTPDLSKADTGHVILEVNSAPILTNNASDPGKSSKQEHRILKKIIRKATEAAYER